MVLPAGTGIATRALLDTDPAFNTKKAGKVTTFPAFFFSREGSSA
jgi:hypothetical protein